MGRVSTGTPGNLARAPVVNIRRVPDHDPVGGSEWRQVAMTRTNFRARTRANGARGRLSGLLLAALLLPAGTMLAQEGPTRDSGDTVARPKPSVATTTDVTDQTKIPSKLNKKADAPGPAEPTFRANITTVNVDVGVLDNKGRFIPGIPAGNFRIMEDGVAQKILHASTGETPITLSMVVE